MYWPINPVVEIAGCILDLAVPLAISLFADVPVKNDLKERNSFSRSQQKHPSLPDTQHIVTRLIVDC